MNNTCKSNEEIDKFIINSGATFSFAFINTYFDSNDYEKPLKHFLDDKFYWPIQVGQNKKTNLFVKQNTITL